MNDGVEMVSMMCVKVPRILHPMYDMISPSIKLILSPSVDGSSFLVCKQSSN